MSSVAVVHAVALGALAVGVNLIRAFEEPRARPLTPVSILNSRPMPCAYH